MISKFYYGRIVYCEADLYSTLQKHISGRVFHSDLKNSVADITISPQSHVAFFLPLLSSWFLQNIFLLNSPLHPFLSPLSNFFTTHILESVSFFQTRVVSLPDFYFSEPLLLAISAPHTGQYRVSFKLSFKTLLIWYF